VEPSIGRVGPAASEGVRFSLKRTCRGPAVISVGAGAGGRRARRAPRRRASRRLVVKSGGELSAEAAACMHRNTGSNLFFFHVSVEKKNVDASHSSSQL